MIQTGMESSARYMTWHFYPEHQLSAGPELSYISRGQKKVVLLANCSNESTLPLRLPLSVLNSNSSNPSRYLLRS